MGFTLSQQIIWIGILAWYWFYVCTPNLHRLGFKIISVAVFWMFWLHSCTVAWKWRHNVSCHGFCWHKGKRPRGTKGKLLTFITLLSTMPWYGKIFWARCFLHSEKWQMKNYIWFVVDCISFGPVFLQRYQKFSKIYKVQVRFICNITTGWQAGSL